MPMFTRRRLLGAAAASLAFAGLARAYAAAGEFQRGHGALKSDPSGVLDLPEGFAYRIISRTGQTMSDGLRTPGKMDGMGSFHLDAERVVLVRNHELKPADVGLGPGLSSGGARCYATFEDGRPLPGGTTTLVYNLRSGVVESESLTLAGTAVNCAGGVTPWGSWLSCEETHLEPGRPSSKSHGWVFEVPASSRSPVEAVPLVSMGRFQHEAACLDPRTGIVYLTEDSSDHAGLFYRFLPESPGRLHRGGRLQALAFQDSPGGGDSRNFGVRTWSPGDRRSVFWIDLDGVESPDRDLRLRGHARGAAFFARGEGVFMGAGEIWFTCTSGGPARAGQIMRYRPSRFEGSDESSSPGEIELFLESGDPEKFNHGDNLAIAPWGDLIICEDRPSRDKTANKLIGVTPSGEIYPLARNAMQENAELAGVCFSPDGSTMFVNIYRPGLTLAVTGPWPHLRA